MRNVYSAFFLLWVATQPACASAENKNRLAPESVPGWVQVMPGVSAAYLANHVGNMARVFDEYVGGLIDQGMNLSESAWLKPVYGNQNLLWIRGVAFGEKMQRAMAEIEKEVSNDYSHYLHGDMMVGDVEWKYYGYQMNPRKGDGTSFQDFVFVCSSNSATGASVFYWGDEMRVDAHKLHDVESLLSMLNSQCQ